MFFSWLNKNKKFDLRKDLSGQITPFLVVALVILLVAAIATINIGRVSLDKTCSANAADAGSLAAASVWASAFNSLTEINRDQIEFWYDVNFYTYGELYKESQEHIDAAITAALESSALAASAAAVGTDYSQCYSIWFAGIAVAALDAAAGTLALEASMEVMAFNMTVMYMKSRITDPFHDQQWSNYKYARDFMDKSYINARKTGLSYAFSNSCIPSKLSDSQNDAFSAWMMQEGPFNEGREEASSYSWEDKIPQTHTVTALLELPQISSYELQHTNGSYSEISALLDELISESQTISAVLGSAATSLYATAALALSVFTSSIITYILFICCDVPYTSAYCCPNYATMCGVTLGLHAGFKIEQIWVVALLAAVVGAAGAGSVYLLKDDNDAAALAWEADGVQSSTSWFDAEDLMIVKIDGVTLPSWIATCITTQTHPGTSSGLMATDYPSITSTSKSKFDGGDVGKFENSYYPRIVETQ